MCRLPAVTPAPTKFNVEPAVDKEEPSSCTVNWFAPAIVKVSPLKLVVTPPLPVIFNDSPWLIPVVVELSSTIVNKLPALSPNFYWNYTLPKMCQKLMLFLNMKNLLLAWIHL